MLIPGALLYTKPHSAVSLQESGHSSDIHLPNCTEEARRPASNYTKILFVEMMMLMQEPHLEAAGASARPPNAVAYQHGLDLTVRSTLLHDPWQLEPFSCL